LERTQPFWYNPSYMKTLEQILYQLQAGQFDHSRHALKRAVERNISDIEILQAVQNARLIEEYPEDKYAPSCLLLGFTQAGRPLHIQVSFIDSDLVRIITLYQPDPTEWIDNTRRR
jgi:hypothetical protein